MNKLIDYYKNKSIRTKLMFNSIIVILLTVITLSMLNYKVVSSSLEEVTNNHTLQMVKQVQNNIEFNIRNMEKIIQFISEDTALLKYIDNPYGNNEEKNNLEEKILYLLDVYTRNELNISGILFADEYGNYLSNNMRNIESNPLTMDSWYIKAVTYPDNIHIFSQPIGRNVRSIYEYYRADNVISIVKAVKNTAGEIKGVLLIDMKLTVIEDIIDNIVLGKSGFLYVADVNNEVVYAPVNPIVYRIHPDIIKSNRQGSIHTVRNTNYQILHNYSEYTGWNVIGIFPTNETMKIIIEVISYIIIYGLIILVLGILFSGLLTGTITKPIKKLRKLMANAENGQLEVYFESKYNDEIGKLGKSFNKMIESIKNLINIVYIEQQKKREAELKAFQAQIKPHFLYNTLDTINWMAQEYEADDISEMVVSLTNLFRISLSKGKEIISLKEEIMHVESYLTIQMARYEEKFDYYIHFDKSLSQCQVIKLILQPIVENAIYHGIKESKHKGHIWINIEEKEDKLCLIVRDDGVGIEVDVVEDMNLILSGHKPKTEKYGIGIFNVNERLKLYFGNDYGIIVESKKGAGTTINIWHPIIHE